MDKEHARLMLESFRPGGADARDADFAEALAAAAQDIALGEWFAEQRAFDDAFASALASLETPPGLRPEISAALAAAADAPSPEYDAHDPEMMGALASVLPPPGLREKIIASMDANVAPPAAPGWWRKFSLPLAAAGGICLALVLFNGGEERKNSALTAAVPSARMQVPIPEVEAGFVKTVSAPDFRLEAVRSDSATLMEELKSRGLPCPCCLPKGLAASKAAGCREFVVDGKHGSVIRFDQDRGNAAYLIVFRREDISCKLPAHGRPKFARNGSWAVAKWATDERVFVLMSQTETERLAEVF